MPKDALTFLRDGHVAPRLHWTTLEKTKRVNPSATEEEVSLGKKQYRGHYCLQTAPRLPLEKAWRGAGSLSPL